MYLSSVLSLLYGAKLIMYDGSPFIPTLDVFLRLISEQRYSLIFCLHPQRIINYPSIHQITALYFDTY